MDKKIPDINKTPQPHPLSFLPPNQDFMPDDDDSETGSHPRMSSSSKKSWIMKLLGK